tara:strand:+ start:73 stop:585 length:513 start_codon:yes stop_codon:yes gene_type:complete
MKIYDNYLTDDEFSKIESFIEDASFKWSLIKELNDNSKPGDFVFIHESNDEEKRNSIFTLLIKKIFTKDDFKIGSNKKIQIGRMRINLFVNTSNKNEGKGFHKDVINDDDMKTLLFYLEDSNGYTEFEDGTIIESKKNRAIVFNSNILHQTVMQTNTIFRRNININFKSI